MKHTQNKYWNLRAEGTTD